MTVVSLRILYARQVLKGQREFADLPTGPATAGAVREGARG
ncbi:hypothetical protein [Streptomyces sp. NPDC008122]